jgi:hypothetical protein
MVYGCHHRQPRPFLPIENLLNQNLANKYKLRQIVVSLIEELGQTKRDTTTSSK